MGTLRYIGSKARVVETILDLIGRPTVPESNFVDLFSGTGIVSREAALRRWKVLANDYLFSSSVMTEAQLLSEDDVPFDFCGGYFAALIELGKAPPVEGFIHAEYSPSGKSRSGHERRYFTTSNAAAIDGIREKIRHWSVSGLLSLYEERLLIADLVLAVNAVANIAGTYGGFLRNWDDTALRPIRLVPRPLLPKKREFRVSNVDAYTLRVQPSDVVYIDPPYTKRQYAAYYHVLETIAVGDTPAVDGITGLRPWEHKASPFCYKRRALGAFERLIAGLDAARIFISYSSEGHVSLTDLSRVLKQFAIVETIPLGNIGRYRPNATARENGEDVGEYLVSLTKAVEVQGVPNECSCYA